MLKLNKKNFLSTLAILIFSSVSLMGQTVVFDNGVGGATGIDDALQSDGDPLPENNNMVEIAADDFSVVEDTMITMVRWIGIYALSNSPMVDDFIIRIYNDNNGPIGSPIATFEVGDDVNRTDSGENFQFILDVFEYSAKINFEASANETYWLSIDARSFADNNDTWFWGSLSTSGNAHITPNLNGWSLFGHSASMVLLGMDLPDELLGDVNCDGMVNLLDVAPFVNLLTNGEFSTKADINGDGVVDLLDVNPFVDLVTG